MIPGSYKPSFGDVSMGKELDEWGSKTSSVSFEVCLNPKNTLQCSGLHGVGQQGNMWKVWQGGFYFRGGPESVPAVCSLSAPQTDTGWFMMIPIFCMSRGSDQCFHSWLRSLLLYWVSVSFLKKKKEKRSHGSLCKPLTQEPAITNNTLLCTKSS